MTSESNFPVPRTPAEEAAQTKLRQLLPENTVVRRRVFSTLLRSVVSLGESK